MSSLIRVCAAVGELLAGWVEDMSRSCWSHGLCVSGFVLYNIFWCESCFAVQYIIWKFITKNKRTLVHDLPAGRGLSLGCFHLRCLVLCASMWLYNVRRPCVVLGVRVYAFLGQQQQLSHWRQAAASAVVGGWKYRLLPIYWRTALPAAAGSWRWRWSGLAGAGRGSGRGIAGDPRRRGQQWGVVLVSVQSEWTNKSITSEPGVSRPQRGNAGTDTVNVGAGCDR